MKVEGTSSGSYGSSDLSNINNLKNITAGLLKAITNNPHDSAQQLLNQNDPSTGESYIKSLISNAQALLKNISQTPLQGPNLAQNTAYIKMFITKLDEIENGGTKYSPIELSALISGANSLFYESDSTSIGDGTLPSLSNLEEMVSVIKTAESTTTTSALQDCIQKLYDLCDSNAFASFGLVGIVDSAISLVNRGSDSDIKSILTNVLAPMVNAVIYGDVNTSSSGISMQMYYFALLDFTDQINDQVNIKNLLNETCPITGQSYYETIVAYISTFNSGPLGSMSTKTYNQDKAYVDQVFKEMEMLMQGSSQLNNSGAAAMFKGLDAFMEYSQSTPASASDSRQVIREVYILVTEITPSTDAKTIESLISQISTLLKQNPLSVSSGLLEMLNEAENCVKNGDTSDAVNIIAYGMGHILIALQEA